jgi:hypothetical protein
MMYVLDPRAGVNLAAHVGHKVQISGVMLDPAKGDDDAEVTITEDTARPRPQPNRALAALCPKDAATLGDTNALRWQKELIRTALNALPIPASK